MNSASLLKSIKKRPTIDGYISPCVENRKSKIHGLGLFAKKTIRKGLIIAGWGGHIVTEKELSKLPKDISFNYALKIYKNLYLAEIKKSELDASDFINHSCNPNCKIINKLVVITKRDVKKGEELTCDFSLPKGKLKTRCNCGSKNCKKTIYF